MTTHIKCDGCNKEIGIETNYHRTVVVINNIHFGVDACCVSCIPKAITHDVNIALDRMLPKLQKDEDFQKETK